MAAAVADLRAGGVTADGMACDVGQLEQVEALARVRGAAVSGASTSGSTTRDGLPPYGPPCTSSPRAFLRTVNTNIVGTYHGSLVAMTAFLAGGRRQADQRARPGIGRTDVADADRRTRPARRGSSSFTQNLAADYKDSGVGIYGINPGMMTTEMLDGPRRWFPGTRSG